jgi:hypothetical protein
MLTPLQFKGEMTSLAASKVGMHGATQASNCILDRGIIEGRQGYSMIGARTSANTGDVGWGMGYGKYSGNDTQRLVLNGGPTGGTFTLTFTGSVAHTIAGQTTAGISFNAAPIDVQTALEALAGIDLGDVSVYGNSLPAGPLAIEFRGQYANLAMNALTGNGASLTGGSSPAPAFVHLVTGGSFEKFVVAIQKNGDATTTMYAVDPDTGVFTSIATGLNASNWYFEQYGQYIYALNGVDGLHYYVLGGSWDNGVSTPPPTAPVRQLQPVGGVNIGQTASIPVFSGYSNFSGWGSNPTPAAVGNYGVNLTINSAITSTTVVGIDISLTVDAALQLRDVIELNGKTNSTSFVVDWSQTTLVLVNDDVSPATITPPYHVDLPPAAGSNPAYALYTEWYDFVNTTRALRDNVKIYRLTLTITKAPLGGVITIYIQPHDNWPLSIIPPDTTPFKTLGAQIPGGTVQYAYSYYRVSDGAESQLSPEITLTVPQRGVQGYYIEFAADVSSQLGGSDKIFLYRKEKSSGSWRRIQNTDILTYGWANTSGPVTLTDAWMESELANFPTYNTGLLGGWTAQGFASPNAVQLGTWKGCLAIGTQRLLLLSWVNVPTQFAPSPENTAALNTLDVNDTSQGVTEYVADNRAGDALGVFGLDAVYVVTADSVYAIVGDIPLTASPPRRLPGSRGGLGTRAACKYSAGVLVGSQDGLWHYAVSRAFSGVDDGSEAQSEATQSVRGSWASLVGSSASGMVVVEYLDEIWAVNGTKFMFLSRNKNWSSGTLTDSMKAALSVRTRGLYWIDSRGRLMKFSYSKTTDNGTSVQWTYTTGKEEGQRMAIRGMVLTGTGTPAVSVTTDDGLNGPNVSPPIKRTPTKDWKLDLHLNPAFTTSFTFTGTVGSDTVETCLVQTAEDVPSGRTN